MARAFTLEQASKYGFSFIVALALLNAGPDFAKSLVFNVGASAGIRWIGVAITVASHVPLVAWVAWSVAGMDEYKRHIVIMGSAIGFLLSSLYSIGLATAVNAHLVETRSGLFPLSTFLFWGAGVCISRVYYYLRG